MPNKSGNKCRELGKIVLTILPEVWFSLWPKYIRKSKLSNGTEWRYSTV